ncbi:hypothetical protein Q5P01_002918 [Channa striata]|uniref:Uncharacterized protein n=1 Tax=Channa striata TaxID=64152 RepID=A0AA88NRY1_CHASR|nr:hypothetical protein Q5P01_002918 [Channa striata]
MSHTSTSAARLLGLLFISTPRHELEEKKKKREEDEEPDGLKYDLILKGETCWRCLGPCSHTLGFIWGEAE